MSFEPVSDGGGVLAALSGVCPTLSETFVMQPQTVMSPRVLAVLWRRYRRMVRSGPRTELDLEATIAERVRRGIIDRPMLRPRRANSARLLILADVSPSMSAWGPFLDALATSLVLSRLQSARLLYFVNVPRQSLFTSPARTEATPRRRSSNGTPARGCSSSATPAPREDSSTGAGRADAAFLAEAHKRMRRDRLDEPHAATRAGQGRRPRRSRLDAGTAFLPLNIRR